MLLFALFPLIQVALATCNGYEALCSRRYSNITYIGAHNSAFDGETIVHNQHVPVTRQLDLGVRFLQAQTQDLEGDIQLCHTYCWELDAGPLGDYLWLLSTWLQENPGEVVTLLLTNIDAIDVRKFDEAFRQADLTRYVFRPPKKLKKSDWPTLQEMIDQERRLVVFMDYHADEKAVDYILDEFQHFWETPYGVTDDGFPSCAIDRPEKGKASGMGIINHMLNYDIFGLIAPDMDSATSTNSKRSIAAHVDRCVKAHGVQPNVVLLDWVDRGQAFSVARDLNSLSRRA